MTASEADIIETKDLGCHAGAEQLAAAPVRRVKPSFWRNLPRTTLKGLMISPKACVLPSDHSVSACGCAAQRRYSRALLAVSTV